MQMFGLVSLMIVIALAAWWLVSMGPVAAPPSDSEAATSSETSSNPTQNRSNYGEALNGAREAAELIGD